MELRERLKDNSSAQERSGVGIKFIWQRGGKFRSFPASRAAYVHLHSRRDAGGVKEQKSSVAVSQSMARNEDERSIWGLVGRGEHRIYCPNGSTG